MKDSNSVDRGRRGFIMAGAAMAAGLAAAPKAAVAAPEKVMSRAFRNLRRAELLAFTPCRRPEAEPNLNTTANFIWSHLDGTKNALELAKELTRHFDVDLDTALQDTLTLIISLKERNLIV